MQAGALLGDGLGDGLIVEPYQAGDFDLNYLRARPSRHSSRCALILRLPRA